ncbi:TonB-dependent receptor [Calditrichota bacterium GD2]
MNHKFSLLFLMLLVTGFAFAQRPGHFNKADVQGVIYGLVFDDEEKVPIEYANIILYHKKDSTQVTGTITDKDGYFKLENVPGGRYYLDVDFIGYAKIRINDVKITPRNREVMLGEIFLEPVTMLSDAVEVEADRVPITYQIDKKVINVSEQATAQSGTAVDVLENVPSVDVDIDGNVSLRGSGKFQVLIDSRPTILEASEVLQQIPASSIQNIEIITNPSAKYDPDGVSGIINIVLKKNKLKGVSGMINASAGTFGRYGGDFLVSYRNKRYVFNVAMDYNRRNFPGDQRLIRNTESGGLTVYNESNGDTKWQMVPYGMRASLDIHLGHWDVLSIGGRIGNRSMERTFSLNYREWTSLDVNTVDSYLSEDTWQRTGDYYSFNVDYQHKWPQRGREFTAQIIYDYRTGDEESINELFLPGGQLTERLKSEENGPAEGWRIKADYIHPFSETTKWEAGYQSRVRQSNEDNKIFQYDLNQQIYVLQPEFNHHAEYVRNIHSLYTTFSSRWQKLGYQIGLRGEYTFRTIGLRDSAEAKIDRLDLFPTAHFSYEIAQGRQIMASYTRRINRARGYWLEPFYTWVDAYNIFRGNPGLKPEYIDSYELGHQLFFKQTLVSLEAFYRVTNNKAERVRSVYPYKENVILHTFENVGKDYALGGELLINRDFFKWWNINYMASVYQYKVEGRLLNQDFSRESFNWSLRLNNDFRLGKNTRFQLSLRYRSPTVTSQGRSEGFVSGNVAIKQQLLDRKLSLTLQLRDMFNTMRHEYTSQGSGFYYYRYVDFPSPMLSLTVSYIFNNYKKERKRANGNGMDDMGGEGDMF